HVYKNVPRLVSSHLGNPLRSCTMIGPGHARLATEGTNRIYDSLIVGGHNHAVHSLRLFGALIDALHHGLARQGNQRLSRQSRGSIAGWYYYNGVRLLGAHGLFRKFQLDADASIGV